MKVHGQPASPEPGAPRWLLLVHQLPVRPSNVRVKTWRRLQHLGAVAVKDSVYLLPNTPQAREDFEWLKTEIVAMKGQATVFAADAVEAASREEILAAFHRARQQDYAAIEREARRVLAREGSRRASAGRLDGRRLRTLDALRQRLAHAQSIDFFGAPGGEEAQSALEELQRRLEPGATPPAKPEGETLVASTYRERIWVTRPRPGIDRMGSAWLIRRFIDPRARFRFADTPEKAARAVPFDMYGVEFGHQGGECTFETMARRFGVRQPGVKWLGLIVHDLDLKEQRYGLPEAAAVGRMVEGLRQIHGDDHELLEQGITMFEALYRSFQLNSNLPPAPKGIAPRKRSARRGSRA